MNKTVQCPHCKKIFFKINSNICPFCHKDISVFPFGEILENDIFKQMFGIK